MPESTDVTRWPGALIDTPEKYAQVIEKFGAEHVGICEKCSKAYFMRSPGKSPVCYGCWYVGELESYEVVYKDVFEALQAGGYKPYIQQTGGMCMTIEIPMRDGHHAWLTDMVDTLSFNREPEDGWNLGVYCYDEENDDGMPKSIFAGEDYISNEVKSPLTAVTLMNIATAKLDQFISGDERI